MGAVVLEITKPTKLLDRLSRHIEVHERALSRLLRSLARAAQLDALVKEEDIFVVLR